jgi:type IV pilus assembly protein PilM
VPAVVGIDISSTAVKLLELSRNDRRYRIESWAIESLPAEAIRDKQVADVDAVANSVRRALERSGCKLKHAAAAVAGSAVITKILTLPSGLNDDDLEGQVQVEAAQFIPYPLEDISLDFHILGTRGGDLVDVMMAACRTETVDAKVSALEVGGLTMRVVDVEAFAIARAAELLPALQQAPADYVTAVFDIGATTTTMIVLREGRLVYTREHAFGGRGLVDDVQRRYGLNPQEAQNAIRNGGLPDSYGEDVLPGFRQSVAVQIGRLLQYFYAGSEYSRVDQIIVSGGVAAVADLPAAITQELGVPAHSGNPLADMGKSSRVPARAIEEGASMMIACGLALRSFD